MDLLSASLLQRSTGSHDHQGKHQPPHHDAATRLNRSPWPSQRPPRLSHQRSTATMTKNAAQVRSNPATNSTTTSRHGADTSGSAARTMGFKPISIPMSEMTSTDCQRGKSKSGNLTSLSNAIL